LLTGIAGLQQKFPFSDRSLGKIRPATFLFGLRQVGDDTDLLKE
jgi:hypothetical protein